MDITKYNGTLMSRDTAIAEIRNGDIAEVFRPELLPLHFANGKALEFWLQRRAIDEHRVNSRLLKKALRLAEKDDVSTVLAVHAATITDTYWLKPEGANLLWSDVRFSENYFADLALRGDLSAFSLKPSRTPELTNIGSYEKCWKLEDGKWWIYKRSNDLERFSELFVYQLGKELGFDMAHYEACDVGVKSLDFTNGASVNFEPAFGLVGDDEDYVKNYRAFEKFGAEVADRYVEIILLDSYCLSADRHTLNYGVLRDVDSGEVLRLAPNYDNNIALISRGYSDKPRRRDLLGSLLHDLERETGSITTYASRNPLPIVTHEMIDRAIDTIGMDVRRDYIHQFVMTGYEQTPIADMAGQQPTPSAGKHKRSDHSR